MPHRLFFAVAVRSAVFLAAFACGFSPNARADDLVTVEGRLDPVYDSLLEPQKRGFLGADGAVSIPIDETRNLWIFGDTIIGTLHPEKGRASAMMLRNSIAIHEESQSPGEPGKVRYYWNLQDRMPGSFFLSENFDQEFWYWPGTGVPVDGQLFLFLYRVYPGDQSLGQFGFKPGQAVLFVVNNPEASPDQWEIEKQELEIGDPHLNFTTGAWLEKPWIYLLGFQDVDVDTDSRKRHAVLARANVEKLKAGQGREALEFWTETDEGEQWSPEPERLKILFTPGVTESSLHYDEKHERFITVTHKFMDPKIYLVTAPEITGPWSEPIEAYHVEGVEDDAKLHMYAAKAHPELPAGPDELILTYVVNTTDFWGLFANTSIYYPRFVRLKLDRGE